MLGSSKSRLTKVSNFLSLFMYAVVNSKYLPTGHGCSPKVSDICRPPWWGEHRPIDLPSQETPLRLSDLLCGSAGDVERPGARWNLHAGRVLLQEPWVPPLGCSKIICRDVDGQWCGQSCSWVICTGIICSVEIERHTISFSGGSVLKPVVCQSHEDGSCTCLRSFLAAVVTLRTCSATTLLRECFLWHCKCSIQNLVTCWSAVILILGLQNSSYRHSEATERNDRLKLLVAQSLMECRDWEELQLQWTAKNNRFEQD